MFGTPVTVARRTNKLGYCCCRHSHWSSVSDTDIDFGKIISLGLGTWIESMLCDFGYFFPLSTFISTSWLLWSTKKHFLWRTTSCKSLHSLQWTQYLFFIFKTDASTSSCIRLWYLNIIEWTSKIIFDCRFRSTFTVIFPLPAPTIIINWCYSRNFHCIVDNWCWDVDSIWLRLIL